MVWIIIIQKNRMCIFILEAVVFHQSVYVYISINRTINIDEVYFYINPYIKCDAIKFKTIEAPGN